MKARDIFTDEEIDTMCFWAMVIPVFGVIFFWSKVVLRKRKIKRAALAELINKYIASKKSS